MTKRNRRLLNAITYWTFAYPSGLMLGIILTLLRMTGRVKIQHPERFPIEIPRAGLLLVSNHPSLWEPLLLYGLFFRLTLLHPIKGGPWSTPDQKNYNDKWYWGGLFGSRFIKVPRGNRRGELRALIGILRTLRAGHVVIMFPEGGRTGREKNRLTTSSGKQLRILKSGIGRLMCRGYFQVVPVWVDGAEHVLPIGAWFPRFWRKMTICVGEPLKAKHICKSSREEIEIGRLAVQNALLKAADEVVVPIGTRLRLAEED